MSFENWSDLIIDKKCHLSNCSRRYCWRLTSSPWFMQRALGQPTNVLARAFSWHCYDQTISLDGYNLVMLSRLAKIIYVEFTFLRSNRTQKLNVIYIYICSRSYNTPSLRDKGSQRGQLLYSGVIFSRWRTTLSPRAEKLLHRGPHSPRELCGVHPLAPKWEGEEELRVTLFISWTHGEKNNMWNPDSLGHVFLCLSVSVQEKSYYSH